MKKNQSARHSRRTWVNINKDIPEAEPIYELIRMLDIKKFKLD